MQGTEPSAEWVEVMGAQWRTLFMLTAAINIGGGAAYVVLGSGERQWWAPAHHVGGRGGGAQAE